MSQNVHFVTTSSFNGNGSVVSSRARLFVYKTSHEKCLKVSLGILNNNLKITEIYFSGFDWMDDIENAETNLKD